KAQLDRSPAVVRERSAEGRIADDAARQADPGGVEAALDGEGRPLRLGADGLHTEAARQDLLAAGVYDPGDGADPVVGVAAHVVLQEVDEAAVLLKETEEVEGRRDVGLPADQAVHVAGERTLRDDAEERDERELDPPGKGDGFSHSPPSC